MAKKTLAVFILAALAASGIFAQEQEQPKGLLSAGGGALIGGDFGGGIEYDGGKSKTPYFGGGVFLFFDATYGELSLGFLAGGGKWGDDDDTKPATITNLNIGLLGKYPFAINKQLSIFPLLGIDYQITVAQKLDGTTHQNKDGDDAPGDFSALWFKFGVGTDFDITSNLYLRGEVLYGFRLTSKAEKDTKDMFEAMGQSDVKPLLGHGLDVKIAVGYRF
jgi:opacity protein-like surface antigen